METPKRSLRQAAKEGAKKKAPDHPIDKALAVAEKVAEGMPSDYPVLKTELEKLRKQVAYYAEEKKKQKEAKDRRRQRSIERAKQHQDVRNNTAGRLPDGSSIQATYSAASQSWSGTLIIPHGDLFAHTRSGIFKLLEDLDGMYRESLKKEEQA